MDGTEFYKIEGLPPPELALRAQLDGVALALLKPEQTVAAFVASLAATGQFQSAVAVLAHALPKREAVWWSCVAVRHATAPSPGSDADTALVAAETWVFHPDEAHRRPTRQAAARAGFQSAAGWAALAAFWSGGSMAPPDTPEVLPDDDLTARAVAGATALAALRPDPDQTAAAYSAFVDMALDIARGGDGRNVEGQTEH
jgi:hypothetical protein